MIWFIELMNKVNSVPRVRHSPMGVNKRRLSNEVYSAPGHIMIPEQQMSMA